MTHAPEGTLVAYLDDEVTAAERAEIEGHLAACDACAAELRVLAGFSDTFGSAVATLDVPAPVAHAHREFVANREAAPGRTRVLQLRRMGVRSLAKAASLALVLAGAASAAIPGSPVRRWVAGAWDRVTALFDGGQEVAEVPVTPPAPPVVGPEEVPAFGAAIPPSNGSVRIVLSDLEPGARVRVRVVDEDVAWLRSAGTEGRLSRNPGRLEAAGFGDVTIDIPRSVVSARVELDGRVLFLKSGDSVQAVAPAETTGTDEFLFTPGT